MRRRTRREVRTISKEWWTMTTQPQTLPKEDATTARQRAEWLACAVCVSVMKVLGKPRDLFRVSAVPVWGNRYRVNVQTGADAVSVRIAHSFFIEADEKGNILQSIPVLERRY
jgi:hypothetical protein